MAHYVKWLLTYLSVLSFLVNHLMHLQSMFYLNPQLHYWNPLHDYELNEPTLQAIPAIYGESTLYMVVMKHVGRFPGKSIICLCINTRFFWECKRVSSIMTLGTLNVITEGIPVPIRSSHFFSIWVIPLFHLIIISQRVSTAQEFIITQMWSLCVSQLVHMRVNPDCEFPLYLVSGETCGAISNNKLPVRRDYKCHHSWDTI